jgi:hypothetical protein
LLRLTCGTRSAVVTLRIVPYGDRVICIGLVLRFTLKLFEVLFQLYRHLPDKFFCRFLSRDVWIEFRVARPHFDFFVGQQGIVFCNEAVVVIRVMFLVPQNAFHPSITLGITAALIAPGGLPS